MELQDKYWTELSTSMVDKIIDKEYQLIESLGHGAYGCLFLGQSLKDNNYFAIKLFPKSNDLNQLKLQQLETDIQSSLKHPYVLALHRVIQENDYFYLVMELCDGGDLFDFVIQDQETNPIRQETVVKKFFTQILDAVDYMHQAGVYHRDLKLENILLQCQNEEQDDNDIDNLVSKVADFGLATRERFSMEFGCGSTSYLAPEHFIDQQHHHSPYDAAASDTWSLAILLLAFMFGRNPWQEASLSDPSFNEFKRHPIMLKEKLFPELSISTFNLLKSALAINPSDRISVSEFKSQFSNLIELYDVEDEGYVIEDSISIPNQPTKKQNLHSFDSAFFSGGNGMSWSDMVEEDEANSIDHIYHQSPLSHSCHDVLDEEEDDMFIHNDEKESWWL